VLKPFASILDLTFIRSFHFVFYLLFYLHCSSNSPESIQLFSYISSDFNHFRSMLVVVNKVGYFIYRLLKTLENSCYYITSRGQQTGDNENSDVPLVHFDAL